MYRRSHVETHGTRLPVKHVPRQRRCALGERPLFLVKPKALLCAPEGGMSYSDSFNDRPTLIKRFSILLSSDSPCGKARAVILKVMKWPAGGKEKPGGCGCSPRCSLDGSSCRELTRLTAYKVPTLAGSKTGVLANFLKKERADNCSLTKENA